MRICFLTHYFPPEVGAAQARIAKLSETLADDGHEVVVHTGFPHYPAGAVLAPYRNAAWTRERVNAVEILRSAVLAAPNRGFARRVADHTAFAVSAVATARLSGDIDVLVAESPPLFTAAAGMVYAALKKAALVVNVADRWPESAVQLGALRDARAIAAARALERRIYRRADVITTPTAGLVHQLDALPEAHGKCRRTWPVVDGARFTIAPPVARPGPLRLLYAGTVGISQDLTVLARASQLAGPNAVHTTIAGDGGDARRVAEFVRRERISNVTLTGSIDADAVPSLYAEADAAAVLLRDIPLFSEALPTKLFEAMAAGRPLLLSARGESARLVDEQRAGLVVDPGSPEALAQGIRELHADPVLRAKLGASGRRFVQRRLGTDYSLREWTDCLVEAAARARHSAISASRTTPSPWRRPRRVQADLGELLQPGVTRIERQSAAVV